MPEEAWWILEEPAPIWMQCLYPLFSQLWFLLSNSEISSAKFWFCSAEPALWEQIGLAFHVGRCQFPWQRGLWGTDTSAAMMAASPWSVCCCSHLQKWKEKWRGWRDLPKATQWISCCVGLVTAQDFLLTPVPQRSTALFLPAGLEGRWVGGLVYTWE